jgi:hypothetical protein
VSFILYFIGKYLLMKCHFHILGKISFLSYFICIFLQMSSHATLSFLVMPSLSGWLIFQDILLATTVKGNENSLDYPPVSILGNILNNLHVLNLWPRTA